MRLQSNSKCVFWQKWNLSNILKLIRIKVNNAVFTQEYTIKDSVLSRPPPLSAAPSGARVPNLKSIERKCCNPLRVLKLELRLSKARGVFSDAIIESDHLTDENA